VFKPKVISAETIYTNSKISVIEEELEHSNGSRHKHLTLQHPGAVVIVPQDNYGELIVLEQYRHSIGETILEFPAGTITIGEEPLLCAKRELEEESGKLAKNWQALGTLFPTPGFCSEIQYLYFASYLTEGTVNLDQDEILSVVKMKTSEVEESIKNGRMKDAKSIAAFYRARLNKLL
jgi:ADP-ribose pyrophosphatase